MLLRNTGCLKYIVLQFLLRTSRIHNQKRNKKHPLILALQFFQQRFRILPISGEIRWNDIHIISGTDRLFLFLDLGTVQFRNRPFHCFDCLCLVYGLHMDRHDLA